MVKVTLNRTVHGRLGTTIWAGRPYYAKATEQSWKVYPHPDALLSVKVRDDNILHVFDTELTVRKSGGIFTK